MLWDLRTPCLDMSTLWHWFVRTQLLAVTAALADLSGGSSVLQGATRLCWQDLRMGCILSHIFPRVSCPAPCVGHRRARPEELWTREAPLAPGGSRHRPQLSQGSGCDQCCMAVGGPWQHPSPPSCACAPEGSSDERWQLPALLVLQQGQAASGCHCSLIKLGLHSSVAWVWFNSPAIWRCHRAPLRGFGGI